VLLMLVAPLVFPKSLVEICLVYKWSQSEDLWSHFSLHNFLEQGKNMKQLVAA
jgi:hypothetical protein